MPIEVVRFGVGHRRAQGPEGTEGLEGRVIHADATGTIAELAFARGGTIARHSNPHPSWLVVIEGGGWVQVGEEQVRVQAGEAILWPANVEHGAWTEHSTMRAILVELVGGGDRVIEGTARPALGTGEVPRGEGELQPRRIDRDRVEDGADAGREGEPL